MEKHGSCVLELWCKKLLHRSVCAWLLYVPGKLFAHRPDKGRYFKLQSDTYQSTILCILREASESNWNKALLQ